MKCYFLLSLIQPRKILRYCLGLFFIILLIKLVAKGETGIVEGNHLIKHNLM